MAGVIWFVGTNGLPDFPEIAAPLDPGPAVAPEEIPPPAAADAEAVIERVVDGDTVVATFGGQEQRVRVLYIDTPESVTPDQPVECLGPEASSYTSQLLPQGTTVRLAFDAEYNDQYGRVLATVFLPDGRSVGTELARAGLARPVQYGENFRYFAEVQAASAEAQAAGVGLFAADLAC